MSELGDPLASAGDVPPADGVDATLTGVATSVRRPDPWGSASVPSSTDRVQWPVINNWRTPLVPAAPVPTPQAASTPSTGKTRSWLIAAIIAAIIGAGIGASTAFLVTQNRSTALITIREGSSVPGAAILASGTSIPKLVAAVAPSVVSVDVATRLGDDEGTGMIISSDGLVLTNNHVVAAYASGGGQITVTRTGTSTEYRATLLGTSPQYDAALLQIQGVSGLPTVTFGNSSKLVVGDGVVAIGNALGLAAGTPTVTSGIVSALGREVSASDAQTGANETLYGLIQTDAAINPGNSGGPLIDSSGQVVGMNTAVAGATSNGSNAQNIGFAIPAKRIESLLPSLISQHLPTTPQPKGAFLGVVIKTMLNPHGPSTVLVVSVAPGDPAQLAGIQPGDLILSINGHRVVTDGAVIGIMSTIKPGAVVKVACQLPRRGERVTFYVKVIKPPSG